MKILDGKKLSKELLRALALEVERKGFKLRLAVIQVGENPVSQIFINQKERACRFVGINFKLYQLKENVSSKKLKEEIEKIIKNRINSGIILQLPLTKKFSPEEFLNLIPKNKDIDVLSEKSLGEFYQGTLEILPPTVNGILHLLEKDKISLKGKNVVIVGAGRLVGNPLALQLLKEKATVSVLNEFSEDSAFFTKKADILISGVGRPNLIKGDMVKKGVVIVDAGCSMKKGKLVGDVDFKSVHKKASYITPVPGGVGPMTVACLIENLVALNS